MLPQSLQGLRKRLQSRSQESLGMKICPDKWASISTIVRNVNNQEAALEISTQKTHYLLYKAAFSRWRWSQQCFCHCSHQHCAKKLKCWYKENGRESGHQAHSNASRYSINWSQGAKEVSTATENLYLHIFFCLKKKTCLPLFHLCSHSI